MPTTNQPGSVAVGFPSEFYESSIFRSMTREMIDQIAAVAEPQRFQDGDRVFVEHDPVTALYLIAKGSIRVTKGDTSGTEREITIIPAGMVVGEMSLLAGTTRSCSGYAVDEVIVYKISGAQFHSLIGQDSVAAHRMVLNLSKLMASRMRAMDEKMVKLLDQSDNEHSHQELAELREKLFTEWAF